MWFLGSGLRSQASTADPKNCFYPSWLGGVETRDALAPDIATCIRKKVVPWPPNHMLVAFFYSFQAPSCHVNMPRFICDWWTQGWTDGPQERVYHC